MKLDLNLSLIKKKKDEKIKDETELPSSLLLLPLSASYEDILRQKTARQVVDYEISILDSTPEYVKKSVVDSDIELRVPNTKVMILQDKDEYKYIAIEPKIDSQVYNVYMYLLGEIERYLLAKGRRIDLGRILLEAAIKRPYYNIFQGEAGGVRRLSLQTTIAIYYLLRNVFGYNILTPLLNDPHVEDISFNGLGEPIHVYYRDLDYTPTNVIINKRMNFLGTEIDGEKFLDQLTQKLISLTGKTISIAEPIADGILPTKDRIAATFRYEISSKGSSFVIRRFNERPITVLDLINSRVLSPHVAAYLWYALDMKMSFMVMGVTGAGKTTLLTSLLNMAKKSYKLVSIEDIPEIKIEHSNWVQLYARPMYGQLGKEISLMDLLKLSLRYRPDIIVVGEIRGQEAYVLFQALSTGHGGATTFHAYDMDSAIKRLMNEPLNIPEEWIPMMNIVISIKRLPVEEENKIVLRRKVVEVNELITLNEYRRIVRWDPKLDIHKIDYDAIKILKSRVEEGGGDETILEEELERRAKFLEGLATIKEIVQDPESYKLVKKYISLYEANPEEALSMVRAKMVIR